MTEPTTAAPESAPDVRSPPPADRAKVKADLIEQADTFVATALTFARRIRRYGIGGAAVYDQAAACIETIATIFASVRAVSIQEVRTARNTAKRHLEALADGRHVLMRLTVEETTSGESESHILEMHDAGPTHLLEIRLRPGTAPFDDERLNAIAGDFRASGQNVIVVQTTDGQSIRLHRIEPAPEARADVLAETWSGDSDLVDG